MALVTGAARRLGRAIAAALAARGAHLAIHYSSSREEAEEAAEELARQGVETWTAQADLRRPEEIDRLFEALQARFGALDLLVNSAASFRAADFDEITAEEWDEVMTLNLKAPFLCTQRAARLMRAGGGGAVVNIVDLSALAPWPSHPHHGVSKAALLHLTRTAALALAPEVRVNAVAPGAILPPPGMSEESEEWRRRGERVPLGRTGDPADVGRAVVYLAENDFVTGALLPVDGGEHLIGR